MKYIINCACAAGLGFVILYSCIEETSPIVSAAFYQIPGCKSNSQILTGKISADSCFSYSFKKNLELDFCVYGNCCPDEKRFKVESSFFKDTILIAVTDTAKNLCKCNCDYFIHGEFESITGNCYWVKCTLRNESEKVLYSVFVKRE